MSQDIVNSRTGVGAGVGAVAGFMLGGPVGAAIGALVGGGVAHVSSDPQKGVMTPKRKLIYTRAMESISSPDDLRKLADAFHGEGLTAEATMLRKRAALRELPKSTAEERRKVFRKAMASDKVEAILQVALLFEQQGAIDAAKALRDHADAVTAAHKAGKSAKPMAGGSQSQFADKLGKAIIHFGPESTQALMAAKNLIQARGRPPTDALAKEVIRVAAEALKAQAPKAEGPPPEEGIAIDATETAADAIAESPGAGAATAPAAAVSQGPGADAPIEPTKLGDPAPMIEPPVIVHGEPPNVPTGAADPDPSAP
jgi:hypothetical protein